MPLKEKIYNDLNDAIKSKNETRTSVLRMLKAEIMKFEVSGKEKTEATDEEIIPIIQKLVKQRKDSEQQFKNGNRPEMADQEAKEAIILQEYLPEQLDETEIRKIIEEGIEQTSADKKEDMGKVMGAIMPKLKGRADGKLVNKIVMEYLK
jgi:hypothetical protein